LIKFLVNRRLFEIEKVSLSRGNANDTNQINLNLSLKVPYWQLNEKK